MLPAIDAKTLSGARPTVNSSYLFDSVEWPVCGSPSGRNPKARGLSYAARINTLIDAHHAPDDSQGIFRKSAGDHR